MRTGPVFFFYFFCRRLNPGPQSCLSKHSTIKKIPCPVSFYCLIEQSVSLLLGEMGRKNQHTRCVLYRQATSPSLNSVSRSKVILNKFQGIQGLFKKALTTCYRFMTGRFNSLAPPSNKDKRCTFFKSAEMALQYCH